MEREGGKLPCSSLYLYIKDSNGKNGWKTAKELSPPPSLVGKGLRQDPPLLFISKYTEDRQVTYIAQNLQEINYQTDDNCTHCGETIFFFFQILELFKFVLFFSIVLCSRYPFVERMRPTMRPYSPKTSAKIKIRIMPTNNLGCCAVPRTPASPTMPMAKPAAKPLRPTLSPAPS